LISAARAFTEFAATIKCAQAHFLLLKKTGNFRSRSRECGCAGPQIADSR